ncbi:MAG: glycosyltransferase [Myxococcales bacterium]|nr:glycosyltransferase [Myxococcales bacterium]
MSQLKVELLFLTYNRLAYTKLSLPALLADPNENFSLTIWDNASTDGTVEYLSSIEDPRIAHRVMSKQNVPPVRAMNECFGASSADLVGFIPNDFLVESGWVRTLAQAHADVDELGLVGCWHLGRDCFDEARARHKIQSFGKHKVLRHPWTDGGAALVKLDVVREVGALEQGMYGSDLIRMARKGYVNGYYYPLLYVEHMDYPWSEYYAYSDNLAEGIQLSVSYRARGIRSIEDAREWHQFVVDNVLDDPWDVKYYVGWRGKLRRLRERLNGVR